VFPHRASKTEQSESKIQSASDCEFLALQVDLGVRASPRGLRLCQNLPPVSAM
jgi:hypothetical protein